MFYRFTTMNKSKNKTNACLTSIRITLYQQYNIHVCYKKKFNVNIFRAHLVKIIPIFQFYKNISVQIFAKWNLIISEIIILHHHMFY